MRCFSLQERATLISFGGLAQNIIGKMMAKGENMISILGYGNTV